MNLRNAVGVVACLSVVAFSTSWLVAEPAPLAGAGGEAGLQRGRPDPAAVERDLLYAAVPGRSNNIGYGGIGILVFDVAQDFRFVKRIPTWEHAAFEEPENVKGVAVSAPLGMIYISTTRRIGAWDLTTEKKVWEQTYDGNCCDRMALSPDGRTMYVPTFYGQYWYVVDAETGDLIKNLPTPALPQAHNTIWSPDGSKVFMSGIGATTMSVADPETHAIVQTVGPFANNVRPFTVNGTGTLIYANVNDLLGFQIGDVETGEVIHTVEVEGYGWARERLRGHGCPSHGIALSPDETEVWVVDGANSSVHVFDNTVMPPRQMTSIQMRDQPYWLTWSADGSWVYASSGDIIDAETKEVIAGLRDELGREVQGEKVVEVLFQGGKPVKAVDQFGVGQVF